MPIQSESLAQGSGAKEERNIMKKTVYTSAPAGIGRAIEESPIIDDFLPSPDSLVYKEDNIKVTLELSRRSVTLFKRYAIKRGFKYQRMLRNLIDSYATRALD